MTSRKKVQNTHMSDRIRALHGALIDIVGVMNRPQRDEMMVREAGISLDRALFPLLVGIERRGPIGIVERQADATDRRVRQAIVTPKGKAMTDAVDAARERIGRAIFATWDERDIDELVRLMRKFADTVTDDDTSEAASAS
jgi:hypothetical protein